MAEIERNDQGQWAPGQSGNPGGRPRGMAAYRRRMLELIRLECGEEQWTAIIRRAIEDAGNGNWRARRWLSDYALGAPDALIDDDGEPITLSEWMRRADSRIKQITRGEVNGDTGSS